MLTTQFIPDFFVAEYYGLRNTIFWGSLDLASEHNFFSMLPTQYSPDFFVAEYNGLRNTIFWGS
jgi:hypothetical protein